MNKGGNQFVFSSTGMSAEQAQATWLNLRRAITEIQNNNASRLRFEELYRNSYTLVLHKHGDLLYDGVCGAVAEKLNDTIVHVLSANTDQLIVVVVEVWDHHKLIMTMIRDILMYMDKTYCKLQKKTLVYDMGLLQFRDKIVRHTSVRPRLQQALLDNIYRDRIGERIDRVLIKHALQMLVEVSPDASRSQYYPVYQEDFEAEFLKTTEVFYKQESQEFLACNTVPDYLRKVESRLREEEQRADQYLHSSTKKKLFNVLERELITNYAQNLVENPQSGCRFMFHNNMIDDLRRMYTLFSRVAGNLDFLRESLSSYVKELGDAIVQDQENQKNPMKFVQDVLDLRLKYSLIVEHSFRDSSGQADRQFSRVLKEAFESFINRDSRAARFLSLYIDEMLRKGLKGVPENEIEEKLDHVITIFRYLSDKDVFEEFYKQQLSSRLLMGKRVSDDVEKQMISKLKAECGHQFTAKLESMFKDMVVSEQIMQGFEQSPLNLNSTNQNFPSIYVHVLTTGSWPIPSVPVCNLPNQILQGCENFKTFYLRQYSGRRLAWQTHLGTAELKCDFKKGKKELLVPTYQMCILMLYNDEEKFSYQAIQEITRIPDLELKRHLLSLAHPKCKILLKEPNVREIEDNHTFSWNDNYTNPLYRVKVNLLSASVAEEKAVEKAEVPESVMEARNNRLSYTTNVASRGIHE
eukprot:TRINITY_DN692_c0_g1_i20.p1 TRINITY_DN692_c0_g1~~TRINITY_DN692_c0_g1_i20.p1  ORF type:complete len:693 (+),score=118.21 TRINITY_DN692_c0_g1_i20:75-2153(+)